jgi:hypothetical protein
MINGPKICIVVTTINSGDMLEGYCRQADAEGVRERLKIVVIPDYKSPTLLFEKCNDLFTCGFNVVCPTLLDQESYLKRFGSFSSLIPYNSDNRRNIGFLMALEWGCDVLVSLDDDNHCIKENNTFDAYAIVCSDDINLPAVHSNNGWFNVFDMLETEPNYIVYPRGFPYHKRHQQVKLNYRKEKGPVRMNAGLWLGDPDLDAITWLALPVQAKSFLGQSMLLGQDTWAPINSQNTSLHRDLIIAYYFVRMGYPVAGVPIDRYGDIFCGYFCQACVRYLGNRIRVGTPTSFHKRNSHNYFHDLLQELACIWALEDITGWLPEAELEGRTYGEAYLSLADALDHQVERFKGSIWTDATRIYFHQMTYYMRQWVAACELIIG